MEKKSSRSESIGGGLRRCKFTKNDKRDLSLKKIFIKNIMHPAVEHTNSLQEFLPTPIFASIFDSCLIPTVKAN